MFLALSASLCGCNFGEAEMERRMQDALDRGDTDEARRIVNEYYDDWERRENMLRLNGFHRKEPERDYHRADWEAPE